MSAKNKTDNAMRRARHDAIRADVAVEEAAAAEAEAALSADDVERIARRVAREELRQAA